MSKGKHKADMSHEQNIQWSATKMLENNYMTENIQHAK